jgi:hypothetical protein
MQYTDGYVHMYPIKSLQIFTTIIFLWCCDFVYVKPYFVVHDGNNRGNTESENTGSETKREFQSKYLFENNVTEKYIVQVKKRM